MSKQQAIVPGQCYQLEDNTSSFKDFHGSRNNRFTTPEQAAKNRIQHPSNVLHFFNAQPDISAEIFNQVKKKQQSYCLLFHSLRFSLEWFYPTGLRWTGNKEPYKCETIHRKKWVWVMASSREWNGLLWFFSPNSMCSGVLVLNSNQRRNMYIVNMYICTLLLVLDIAILFQVSECVLLRNVLNTHICFLCLNDWMNTQ